MQETYIYGIRDLEVTKFIYVGKSNEPLGRFTGHMRRSDNEDVRKLVEEKSRKNFQLEILETVEFEAARDWIKQERFWIAKLRKRGHPLCNRNNGGGGVNEVSKEARAKISKALMGHEVAKETRDKISKGKTNPSEETRAKMRKPKSEEHKANLSKSLTGRELTDEHCTNISKALIGRELTDGHRAKLSKAKMGHETTEETRAKIGETKAKPYPAFYNVKTQELIPAGRNLRKLCRGQDLNYLALQNLKHNTHKQSHDGWQLVGAFETLSSKGAIT